MKFGNSLILVTNWHVLSGRNLNSNEMFSKYSETPDEVSFHIIIRETDDNGHCSATYFKPIQMKLHDKDGNPIWMSKTNGKIRADVAFVDLMSIGQEIFEGYNNISAVEGGRVTLKKGVQRSDHIKASLVNHFYPKVGYSLFILEYPLLGFFQFGKQQRWLLNP